MGQQDLQRVRMMSYRRGETHPAAKWKQGTIDAIRDMYEDGYANEEDLARLTNQPYQVVKDRYIRRNMGWVSRVVTRRIWSAS